MATFLGFQVNNDVDDLDITNIMTGGGKRLNRINNKVVVIIVMNHIILSIKILLGNYV